MERKDTIDKKINRTGGSDFLVNPPGWILHNGITLVASFILILLVLAVFIKYPDKISAEAIITTSQPPLRMNAPKDGKLIRFGTDSGDTVNTGDVLAVFEHEGSLEQLNQLDSLLNNIPLSEIILEEQLPQFSNLGSISASFANFKKAVADYRHEIEKDFTSLKILNLKNQIANLQSINEGLKRQLQWRKQTLSITQTQLTRDSNLFLEGSVSAIEYEDSRKEMFNLLESMENLNASVFQNKLNISQLEGQILETGQTKSDQVKELEGNLDIRLKELKGEIEVWKSRHFLVAPYEGLVEVPGSIKPFQYFEKGQFILSLLPTKKSEENKGLATIPFKQSGKVKEGAKIHLKLEGYPYKEFGYINSTVENIAAVANEKGYQVSFNLPIPLKTSYGLEIPFKQEMRGTAEIITKERTIMERFFEQILSLIKNN